MAHVFSLLIRLTMPLWSLIARRPWLSAAVSAALAVLFLLLDVKEPGALFALATGGILVWKAEADRPAARTTNAPPVGRAPRPVAEHAVRPAPPAASRARVAEGAPVGSV